MVDDEEEVVIIGAGVCGLATAVALNKKGIKSVVMEKSESLRNVTGAAIGIRQNGWRALDQLGVADILRPTAIPLMRERMILLKEGKQQQSSMVGETRCLRRKDLLNTLYDALPPDTVQFGRQLESIKLNPATNKPVLRFIDGRSIIAKVVIGCEGGRSIVADFLNVKPTKMFPSCNVRGLTNYPNGHSFDPDFTRFRSDTNLVGTIPIDDKLVYWFCGHPNIPKDERIWKDPEVIRQSTLKLLSDYPQEIQDMIENADTKSLIFSNIRYRAPWDLLTGTFCKGTMTVAGDAMHVMGPFLGQGGSAGLEDAVVLARNMAQLGLNSEGKLTVKGVEEAFNLYVKQRRMRVVRLSLQTYLTGMLVLSSGLKKVVFLLLLSLLFSNKNGHCEYDCGGL